MSFNLNTRIPGVQGNQTIKGSTALPNPQNNVFYFANRRPPTASETNGLPVLRPAVGYPFYEYYKTYKLPTEYVNDALGLLAYFKSCGFSVGYGYSASEQFLAIPYVDISTLAAKNQAIVYLSNSANLVAPLIGASVTGTFTQLNTPVSGDFVSAAVGSFTISSTTYDSKIILHSSQFASITAGDSLVINFLNSGLLVPNPATTEPFIMNLYQAALASLIPQDINSTTASPNVYFGILPNASQSGLFGPQESDISLTPPVSIVSPGVLRYAIPSLNVSLIPITALGNSTISQETSNATGTIVSAQINNNLLTVTLSNVTGTFNTTNDTFLTLDPTQTVFNFQEILFANNKISLAQTTLPYPVNSNTDITTTYAPAFTYVNQLNSPASSENGQAICQIVFGNTSIGTNLALSTLPTAVNNYQYQPVYYPYVPVIGELPLSVGQLTAAYAMVVGSNVYPFNPQCGVVINGLPVPNDVNKYLSTRVNGETGQIMKIGWNVITVNTNQQAFIVAPQSGQTTLPGTPTPDVEFYGEDTWQVLDYLRKLINNICLSIGLGKVRQDPKILGPIKGNIVSAMLTMQGDGILMNVKQNEAYITIKRNLVNPLGIDIIIPTQIIPALRNIYFTINLYSSTATLIA